MNGSLGGVSRWWLLCAYVVLLAGLVVAFSDAGLPLPVVLVIGALTICLIAIAGAGVVGYRDSRAAGRGRGQSMGMGVRRSFRALFFLF